MMISKTAGRILRACVLAVAAMAVAVPASAEGLRLSGASSKSRASQFQRQTQLMDSRLSGQYQRSQKLRPDAGRERRTVKVIELDRGAIPAYRGNQRSKYLPHARAVARKHGIPEDLFLRLVQQESGWNPAARSHKGARGLAQLRFRVPTIAYAGQRGVLRRRRHCAQAQSDDRQRRCQRAVHLDPHGIVPV